MLLGAWAEELWTLLVRAAMAVLTYVVEYAASVLGVKRYGGSKRAMAGAAIVGIVGHPGNPVSCLVLLSGRLSGRMQATFVLIGMLYEKPPMDHQHLWNLFFSPIPLSDQAFHKHG